MRLTGPPLATDSEPLGFDGRSGAWRDWYGHTRGLTIDSIGHAVEYDQRWILRPGRRAAHDALSTARHDGRVTSVHVYDMTAFGPKYPPPHPGERTTLHLANGVITEPLTRINYCDMAADLKGTCGA
jgi:hypothetical protein